jgi:tight adherence protein B
MATLTAIFAFIFGVILVFGLGYGALQMPSFLMRRKLDARLQELSFGDKDADETAHKTLLKTLNEGPLPKLNRILSGTSRGGMLANLIEQSGSRSSLSSVLFIMVMMGLVGAMVAAVAMRVSWSMPAGFAFGAFMPIVVLRMKRTKRLRAFEEQFPEALDLVSRALKAGHAFATGLKMIADELPEPVGPEFRKTFDEQNFGLPLKDALENLTTRIPLLDVRFFATAVLIQRETGGNLSEILENLAHVVRERFKILRQVRVYTAHGRMTGYVLLALPAFLSVALMFINPEHMNLLFRERMGQMMLMGAIVMQTCGFLWIKQIVKIEV